MAVSRREFLQRSGLLAAGALLPVSVLAQADSLSRGKGTNGTGTTGTGNGTILQGKGVAPSGFAPVLEKFDCRAFVGRTPQEAAASAEARGP